MKVNSVEYSGKLAHQKLTSQNSATEEDKWTPSLTNGFASASAFKDKDELWVVRVPVEFDQRLLEGNLLRKEKLKLMNDVNTPSPLFKVTDSHANEFLCRSEGPVMEILPQLHCLIRSGKADNALKVGPSAVRGFDIVQIAGDDAMECENMEENDRIDKIKDVVSRLVSKRRPQVKMTTRFRHLGEKSSTNMGEERKQKRKREKASPGKKKRIRATAG